ncbi:hypothetical protein FHR50_002601 [Xanthomonas arboricola]
MTVGSATASRWRVWLLSAATVGFNEPSGTPRNRSA